MAEATERPKDDPLAEPLEAESPTSSARSVQFLVTVSTEPMNFIPAPQLFVEKSPAPSSPRDQVRLLTPVSFGGWERSPMAWVAHEREAEEDPEELSTISC